MFYILMWRTIVALPEHGLQHLEHRPIVGHVQNQLDLLLLLELVGGAVVRVVVLSHHLGIALDLLD